MVRPITSQWLSGVLAFSTHVKEMMVSLTFTVDITEDGSVEMKSDIDMRDACELTENIETVLNAVATSIIEVHHAFHMTDDVRKDIESL